MKLFVALSMLSSIGFSTSKLLCLLIYVVIECVQWSSSQPSLHVRFFVSIQVEYQVSEQRIDDLNDGDAINVAPSSSSTSTREMKPTSSNIVAPTLETESYVGILSNKRKHNADVCPPENIVECYHGMVGNETCADACGDQCCEGERACDGLTGSVCKDGASCVGDYACYYTYADMISGSCTGPNACDGAGYNYGRIDLIHNSCLGESACANIANNEGSINEIVRGCQGSYSCESVAHYGGSIGKIEDSCLGESACSYAAHNGGSIDGIVRGCNGEKACGNAAYYGGVIGAITDSCSDSYSCYYAGACFVYPYGDCGSSISLISSSCDGVSACAFAASDGGFIKGIKNGCNNDRACYAAGYDENMNTLSSGIKNCCNEEEEICSYASGASLPGTCGIAISQTANVENNSTSQVCTTTTLTNMTWEVEADASSQCAMESKAAMVAQV